MDTEQFIDGIRYVRADLAASEFGRTREYLITQCRNGKIVGRQFGKIWYIQHASLVAFVDEQEQARKRHYERLAEERSREYEAKRVSQSVAPKTLSNVAAWTRLAGALGAIVLVAALTQMPILSSSHDGNTAMAFAGTKGFLTRFLDIFKREPAPSTAPVASGSGSAPEVVNNATYNTTNNNYTTNNNTYNESHETIVQGATEEAVDSKLSALSNSLRNEFTRLTYIGGPPASGGLGNNVALSQRIDNLSGVDIVDSSWVGGTIEASSLAVSGGVDFSSLTLTTALAISSGGTGTSTAPAYGQVLLGNASGTYDLVSTSSLGIVGGGAGTPGGSDSQIQFNNNGSFAGSSAFTFSSTTELFSVTNASTTNASTTRLFAQYASTTQATSTSLFSVLGRFTSAIIDSLSATVATIANLTATTFTATTASTTQLSNVGTAYFGGTATSSFDSTGALTLAAPLATSSGGTGISSYSVGDMLYVNSVGILSRLSVGSPGQVLKVSAGVPGWGADATGSGGGGAGLFATSSDNLLIYPTDTSYVLALGASATTTTGNILEVAGNALFRNALTTYGTLTVPRIVATTTLASSFVQASSTRLSVFDRAYFGGTSTTTIDSTGAITVTSTSANTFPYASSTAFTAATGYFTSLFSSTASSTSLVLSGIQNGLLSTDADGDVVATTTPTALSFNATSNTASRFPYASSTAFTASTGYISSGLFTSASSTNLLIDSVATTTSLAVTGLTSSLLSTNALGQVVATTSVGASYITGALGTVNGTTFNRGDSITVSAASSSLLADNNNFTGINRFTYASSSAFTSTSLYASAASSTSLTLSGINSAVLVAGASGSVAAASTQTCTNQFVRSLSAAYVATCASISPADLADADFGDFTTSGGLASLDADTVSDSEIDYSTVTLADFTNDADFVKWAAASSTLWQSAGLLSSASSTIGSGTQAGGLTISGGATTTGNAYFAGSVGMGTTTPWGRLSLTASDNSSFPQFVVASSSAVSFIVDNRGYVGIGTTSPIATLELATNNSNSPGVRVVYTGAPSSSNGPVFQGYLASQPTAADQRLSALTGGGPRSSDGTLVTSGAVRILSAEAWGATNQGTYLRLDTTAIGSTVASERLRITDAGNIGIGTTTPWGKLSVNNFNGGTSALFVVASSTAGGATSTALLVDAYGNTTLGGTLALSQAITSTASAANTLPYASSTALTATNLFASSASSTSLTISGLTSGRIPFASTAGLLADSSLLTFDGTKLITSYASTTALTVSGTAYFAGSGIWNSSGFVGIGTTTPWAQLSVSATDNASAPQFVVASSSAVSLMVASSGNVGIGTTTPGEVLTVHGDFETSYGINYFGPYAVGQTQTLFRPVKGSTMFTFQPAGGNNMMTIDGSVSGVAIGGNYAAGGATPPSNGLIVQGNVGIGTTTPAQKLDVYSTTALDGILVEGTTNPALSFRGTGITGAYIGYATAVDGVITGAEADDFAFRTRNSGDIIFSANNGSSVQFTIETGGNVGIGTSTPYAPLTVNGITAAGDSTWFERTGVRTWAVNLTDANFNIIDRGASGASSNTRFTIDTSGEVGIGTTTPNAELDVVGQIRTEGTGTANGFLAQQNIVLPGAYSNLYADSSDRLILQSWSSQPLAINPSGNKVGIGTSTPGANLEIYAGASGGAGHSYSRLTIEDDTNAAISIITPSSAIGYLLFGDEDSSTSGYMYYNHSSDAMGFYTAGSERLRITSSGNVGIGTTTPTNEKVLVNSLCGTTNCAAFRTLYNDATTVLGEVSLLANRNGAWSSLYVNGAGSSISNALYVEGTDKEVIFDAGNVGIFDTTPSYALDVAGFINVDQYSGYKQAAVNILVGSSTSQSVMVGQYAGDELGYGVHLSTAVGYNALTTATSSLYNTAVGAGALDGIIDLMAGAGSTGAGSRNAAVGTGALGASNNSGSFNSALGYGALGANNSGYYNTGIGYAALNTATSSLQNTAVGALALDGIVDNSGVLAGANSGSRNTAVGYAALTATGNSGSYNTGVGYTALAGNTTGEANTALGYNAMGANTSGENNTVVGYAALDANLTGTSNVSLGMISLTAATSSSNHVALGYGTLTAMLTGSNNDTEGNVAIGYNAGSAVTYGGGNVLVGLNAGDNITTGNANIVIGYALDAPSATSDDQLTIGNLIFGTGLDGTGTTVSSGNIGIGTSSPQDKLHIVGATTPGVRINHTTTSSYSNLAFYENMTALGYVQTPGSAFATTDRRSDLELFAMSTDISFWPGNAQTVTFKSGGNVGLGTTTPGAKLDIVDTASDTIGTRNHLRLSSADGTNYFQLGLNASGGFSLDELAGTASNLLTATVGGSVGIGTTTPWRTLSVTGTVGIDGLTASTGAGSLCLSSTKQVVYNAASDACLSSLRATKHDISALTVDALSQVLALESVSFVYNDSDGRVRYGFIAEDTAAVDPHLATYDASSTLSGIDDRSILSIVVKAIQQLYGRIEEYMTRTERLEERVASLEAQIAALGSTQQGGGSGTEETPEEPAPEEAPADTEAPVISVIGANPATINIGDTYSDLGASVTDEGSPNIGIETRVDGGEWGEVGTLYIDTAAAGTHTVEYRATDAAGNVGTAERVVEVVDPNPEPEEGEGEEVATENE